MLVSCRWKFIIKFMEIKTGKILKEVLTKKAEILGKLVRFLRKEIFNILSKTIKI